MKNANVTIFFLADGIPSEEELAEASKIAGVVKFRNAAFVTGAETQLEDADAYAGKVPENYAEYAKAKASAQAEEADASPAPAAAPADAPKAAPAPAPAGSWGAKPKAAAAQWKPGK